jgi:hypothetical protein
VSSSSLGPSLKLSLQRPNANQSSSGNTLPSFKLQLPQQQQRPTSANQVQQRPPIQGQLQGRGGQGERHGLERRPMTSAANMTSGRPQSRPTDTLANRSNTSQQQSSTPTLRLALSSKPAGANSQISVVKSPISKTNVTP